MAYVTVRPASPSDNDALLALSGKCPMEGAISLYIDRSPTFARIYELLGAEDPLLVAISDGRLVGALGRIRTHLHLGGRHLSLLCLRDLKVAPESRGGRTAYLLLRRVVEEAAGNLGGALALILRQNRRAQKLTVGGAGLPGGFPLHEVIFHNIAALIPRQTSLHWLPRPLKSDDASAVAAVLQGQSTQALAPVWNSELLERLCQTLPGFGWDDVWGVDSDGELVAVVASWNARLAVNYRVKGYSRSVRLLQQILEILAQCGFGTAMPPLGEPLRFRMVIYSACKPGAEAGLTALFRHLAERTRFEGLTHFTVCLPKGDRREATLPRLFGTRISYVPYFIPNPRAQQPAPIEPGNRIEVPFHAYL